MEQRMTAGQMQKRAISKALAMGGAATVRRVRYGTYQVASASRPGTVHTVSVVGANWFCTCEARLRPACWHRAAVLVAKTEAGGGRVVAPAAAPAPALRPVVTVDDEGRDDYCGEDDETERAIEARNDEWASRDDPRAA